MKWIQGLKVYTVNGTNLVRKPPGMYQTLVNNRINYQPQQVSRISSINGINFLGEYIIHSLFSFLKPPIRFPLTAVARRLVSAALARIFGSSGFFEVLLLDQMEK